MTEIERDIQNLTVEITRVVEIQSQSTKNINMLTEDIKQNICMKSSCAAMEKRISEVEDMVKNIKDIPNKILWKVTMVVTGALALAFVSQYTSKDAEILKLQQYQAVQYQALKEE